ncbi:PAS domain S-box protein [Methanoplanus limicola]|uniref:histidine kinase n=1 Tax=Methanoplanus limicola DSM 2279 TaxID=937775 RepID=H1YZK7_9EURY|nr:PAS domain S-box protein [Methanoplanus limicola]EHQ36116.1 putative PAS/PAC sensor protein [Methanoplanus limicola DSM 2279]
MITTGAKKMNASKKNNYDFPEEEKSGRDLNGHIPESGGRNDASISGKPAEEGGNILSGSNFEALCHFFIGKIPDGAFVMDSNGKILFSNNIFAEFTGISPQNLYDLNFRDIFGSEYYEVFPASSGEITGAAVKDKTAILTAYVSGNDKHVTVGISLFKIPGERDYLCVIVKDPVVLKEKEHAEVKSKKESEFLEHLRMAIDGGELGTWEWDVATGDAVFNDRWFEMLDYNPRDFKGSYDSWLNLIHPDDTDRVLGVLNAHLAGETPIYEAELRLRGRNGRYVWVLTKGRVIERDANNKPVRVVGTNLDITGRKIAEQKLNENMRLFRGVFDYSFDYLGVLSPDGILEQVNETALSLIGKSHEDVEGLSFPNTPWWTHSEAEQAKLREVIARASSGDTVRYETTHVSGEGILFDIDFSLKPVFDESGKVIFLIAEGRDITELKKTENELRESKENLQTILEHLPRGLVSIIDSEMRYILCAGEELNRMGLSEDFFNGKTVYECHGYESGQKIADSVRRAVSEGITITIEEEHDGQAFLVRITPLQDPDGEIRRVIMLSINVTQEKKAEKQLRAEKELFRSTFESLTDAAFVLGIDPVTIILANKAAMEIFGYLEDELIGKTTDFLHADDESFENFREYVYSHLTKDKKIPEFEFKMRRKSGEVFPTEHFMSPLFDESGIHTGWVSFVRDITEEKEAKKRELAAMDQIQHNIMQLATLNDSIRNPLAVIRAVTDMEDNLGNRDILNDQIESIDDIIRKLDMGWLESEKIWNYLRKYHGMNKPEGKSMGEKDE